MKTVFKKEMEVYDYTYGKGEIIEIQNYSYLDNILLVKFEDRDALIKYSLDGRLINYKSCGGELDSENIATNPTLSTSPYTLQGFEQKAPAPTYEEALKEAHRKDEYYHLPNDLEAPNKELADATIALLKVLFLRDYYNEGWQPNWIDQHQEKFCIINFLEEIDLINYSKKSKFEENKFYHILTFKTEEIRDKFLEEQKELLEIAKPLL